MSIAKKCDRCQRYFEVGRNEPLWCLVSGHAPEAALRYKLVQDYCYRCSATLDRWLKDYTSRLPSAIEEQTQTALRREPEG